MSLPPRARSLVPKTIFLMAYDPTKPVNGAPIVAAELRSQFAGLNDNISNVAAQVSMLPSQDDVLDTINANTAGSVAAIPPPNFTVSNPPTQAQVQAVADYLNQLYVALSRT